MPCACNGARLTESSFVMESLYLLIPMSVLLVFLIGVIFWWSVRSGQFDDLEGPGYRVVSDDDTPPQARDGSSEKSKGEA